jgi:hypothetical protein
MSTLLDTSILTRGVYKSDPLHQIAIDAVDKLGRQGETLVLVPQNFYEFGSCVRGRLHKTVWA